MELNVFTEMFCDGAVFHFEKMYHKYGRENFLEFIAVLKKSFYTALPLADFEGNSCTLLLSKINLTAQLEKALHGAYTNQKYGAKAMEEEIVSTLSIEAISSSKDSVRRILNGGAPNDENENKAFGIKRGLDFIADTTNKITEFNLQKLYMLSVGDFLEHDKKLLQGNFYRHDSVFVVGSDIAHAGLQHFNLPKYMSKLIEYINSDDDLDQIVKSIVIHYYFAYLHPYFDGNGRMARLLQLWYLMQKGYSQALFVPFSRFINLSRARYYKAFEQIAKNSKLSGVHDITGFVDYFVTNVFMKFDNKFTAKDVFDRFNKLLCTGSVTQKEKELFEFILSNYGYDEFSTKQLEKDCGCAAYATIRAFVLKFEERGLLISRKYGSRVKYAIKK